MQERLDELERNVAELTRQVRALQTVVRELARGGTTDSASAAMMHAGAASAAPGPEVEEPVSIPNAPATRPGRRPPPRGPVFPRRAVDFEALVGRYGALALASLTILMGVGAFLGWAIAHGKIGPGMRVVLGALAAAAVAVTGWRLRSRGSKRFGSTLLALALALVHVDAWGAGPYLHLVPAPIALSIAAAASVALAALAWRGNEEALFSVGVGGALLAPFVTSSESGSTLALLAYGYVVLASGLVALRGRAWRTASAVVMIGVWLYAAAGAQATPSGARLAERDLPAIFSIAVALTVLLVPGGRWTGNAARAALTALVGVLAVAVPDRAPAMDLVVLAAVGTAVAYAVGHLREQLPREMLLTAAFLPMALGAVAVVAVRDTPAARGLAAAAWTIGAIAAASLQPGARATHLMVAGIASGAALLLALEGRAVASCVALSAHAAALSLLVRRERTHLLGVPITVGLAIVTIWTFDLLSNRALYGYTPLLTTASLAGAAMSVAWLTMSWQVSRTEFPDVVRGQRGTPPVVRLAGGVVAFFWIREELGRAYSLDVATLLLVLYYATAGVAAIFVGRQRRIPILRHAGLALAMFAAVKAIAQASSLTIGARVGSYFLAGLFLLAVAYWYREKELQT